MARSEIVNPEDLDGSHARWAALKATGKPPALFASIIKIEGLSKSGKSGLLAGNPNAVIAHLPEGEWCCPRTRAEVFQVPDFKTFLAFRDYWLDHARKHGTRKRFNMFVIDPATLLVNSWLMEQEVLKSNRKNKAKFDKEVEGGLIEASEWKNLKVTHISEIREYGSYNRVARRICELFLPFKSYGWGVGLILHYKKKMQMGQYGNPSGSLWLPDVPDTANNEINQYVDVRIIATKEVMRGDDGIQQRIFHMEFESTASDEIGSRVPLRGTADVPDYFSKASDPGVTAWDVLSQRFDRAVRTLQFHEGRFHKQDDKKTGKA